MAGPAGTLAAYADPQEGIEGLRRRSVRLEAERASRGLPDNCRMLCRDCNCSDEGYMVTDSVWEQAHPEGRRGLLCLHCLEDRLGRLLTAEDLTNALINLPILYGIRIAQRSRLEVSEC